MASVFEKPPVRQIGNDLHLFPAQRLYGVFQPFPYRDHGIRGIIIAGDRGKLLFAEHIPFKPRDMLRNNNRHMQPPLERTGIPDGAERVNMNDIRLSALTENAEHFAQNAKICKMEPQRLYMDQVFRKIAV